MERTSFLDTIWARLIAGLVALTAAGSLAYLNREAFFAPPMGSQVDAHSACLEERFKDIDDMVADGTVKPGQAAEFRIRARQLCQ